MSDRTSINIAQGEHKATREVKEEYDESWTDVLRFYREHRPEVEVPVYAVGDAGPVDSIPAGSPKTDGPDVAELAEEVEKLREEVNRVPETIAEELQMGGF